MPIRRTYMCPECGNRIEVVLSSEEWDAPPPSCEACDAHAMNQDFTKGPAIGGSVMAKAARITEDIIANDYNVSNITFDRKGGPNKVTYKDQSTLPTGGSWLGQRAMLEQAISIGRNNRAQFGVDGLDILKKNLASGVQPDLIEASKRRSIKVW